MYLLDTNVLSEIQKAEPDYNVLRFMGTLHREHSYTSSIVLFELLSGAEMAPETRATVQLLRFIDWLVTDRFDGRILAYNLDVARTHAHLFALNRKGGRPKPKLDLQIAATALTHDLTLVTRNTKDFTDLGLHLLNPWKVEH